MRRKFKRLSILLVLLPTAAHAQISFTKATGSRVVLDGGASFGSSWADYDNDGDLDLFVTNLGQTNFFYVNDGSGTFTRLEDLAIVNETQGFSGSSWGDFDNDGDLDVFVTVAIPVSSVANILYRNNGDGSFVRTSGDLSGLGDEDASFGSAWADFDNNGYLDLFVANAEVNFIFHSQGDPNRNGHVSFGQDRGGVISRDRGFSNGCSWADYDNDGDLDLFVATGGRNLDHRGNFLYRNNGDGSFSGVMGDPVVTDSLPSIGGSWGDYDNDGDLDLFVTNPTTTNSLYQNNGDGSFTAVTEGDIVNLSTTSWGSSWADFDNDGDLDLFVANDQFASDLFENTGVIEGTNQIGFSRLRQNVVVTDGGNSNSASSGDIDNDGDIDLFVANGGSGAQANFLYFNDGTSNNWINITCVGSFSNRSAIGAKVRILATIFGQPVWQMREISAQTGHLSQNSMRAAFGLGDAVAVDSILVEWPSGRTSRLANVAVDQFMTLEEPIPVSEPVIAPVEVNTDITVLATDASGTIAAMDLIYRRGGASRSDTVAMAAQGAGVYSGVIAAEEVTAHGVEYRLELTDAAGLRAPLPTRRSLPIRVHSADGVSSGVPRPHGDAQTAYRIFSAPLEWDDGSPATLLVDDLGEYDETRWRFSEFLAGNTFREFAEIPVLESGKGYWFLVSEPARVIDTGAGTSFPTTEEFAIPVTSGWNLIGNPFAFPIPVTNLRLASGTTVVLRSYSGLWNDPISEAIAEISPFQGYAINSIAAETDTLFIDPYVLGTGQSPAAKAPIQRVELNTNLISWSIRILARSQEARDTDNSLGVSPHSVAGTDALDFPEPPPVGEYVQVYFPHPERGGLSQDFSTDFRPPIGAGATWEFEVKSNIDDRIRLVFDGLESVPQMLDVWLVDEALTLAQNLKADGTFFLASPGESIPKRLKIMVGSPDFVAQQLGDSGQIPREYELGQNFPNPFNPVTTIRYGLPKPGRATLKVFDLAGREVVTVVDGEQKTAGYHVAVWDGHNAAGKRVASGIYFMKLKVGIFVETRKMAFIQ